MRDEGGSCPGGQRKLPAISGRQFKHGRPAGGRGREEGFDQDPVTKGAFCNLCEKRFKMVGSVGSPMRSQSLARLHAVGPHVHVYILSFVDHSRLCFKCIEKTRKVY